MDWDFIVVGGGSAGCVLASRLSEDPNKRVLLVEAGRDLPPGTESAALLDMFSGPVAADPANHWSGLFGYVQPVPHNHSARPKLQRYEQPKIMGGGSSINGQVANRGTPSDFDEWCRVGATGWSWSDVLPYFVRLENDSGRSGPLHGKTGPIPIHRIDRKDWPEFSLAVEQGLSSLGFDDIDDQNAHFGDGYFPITLSNDGTSRVSTARGYLPTAVRQRPNLKVLASREVHRVVIEDGCAVGIELRDRGLPEVIKGRRIVISAGAIHSPALLLKSGVGPSLLLRNLGVEVQANLRGVGSNLQEHPGISLIGFLRKSSRLNGKTSRHIHLGLRYSSHQVEDAQSDMYLMAAAKSAWHPLGSQIGTLISWINKPFSRGKLYLDAAHPGSRPVIEFNHLSDPRDASRLIDAVRFMANVFMTPTVRAQVSAAGPASLTGLKRALGKKSVRNYLLTAPAASILDLIPFLQPPFLRNFVTGGHTLNSLLQDDDALESYVREGVFGQWHPCGTCKMGSESDPDAVVSAKNGEVLGISRLHVADASVMPTIPRANLNIPTIMVAEKLADAIRLEKHL